MTLKFTTRSRSNFQILFSVKKVCDASKRDGKRTGFGRKRNTFRWGEKRELRENSNEKTLTQNLVQLFLLKYLMASSGFGMIVGLPFFHPAGHTSPWVSVYWNAWTNLEERKRQRRLHTCWSRKKLPQSLVDGSANGEIVHGDLSQDTLAVDDEETAQCVSQLLQVHAVVLGNFMVQVAEQRNVDVSEAASLSVSLDPREMREVRVHRCGDDFRVELSELFDSVRESQNLRWADECTEEKEMKRRKKRYHNQTRPNGDGRPTNPTGRRRTRRICPCSQSRKSVWTRHWRQLFPWRLALVSRWQLSCIADCVQPGDLTCQLDTRLRVGGVISKMQSWVGDKRKFLRVLRGQHVLFSFLMIRSDEVLRGWTGWTPYKGLLCTSTIFFSNYLSAQQSSCPLQKLQPDEWQSPPE